MASTYILYSPINDSFYVGSCHYIQERLKEHISKEFKGSYTSKVDDWELYFLIENLDYSLARKIELHIKRMKSKQYILNLKIYPEMTQKLLNEYL